MHAPPGDCDYPHTPGRFAAIGMQRVRAEYPTAIFDSFDVARPIDVHFVFKDHRRCYFEWEFEAKILAAG